MIPKKVAVKLPMAPKKKPSRERRPTFLAAWRKKKGLTQADAAEALGFDQSKFSKTERGSVPYDQDFLEECSVLYGCTVLELLERDPLHIDPMWELCDKMKRIPPTQLGLVQALVEKMLDSQSTVLNTNAPNAS